MPYIVRRRPARSQPQGVTLPNRRGGPVFLWKGSDYHHAAIGGPAAAITGEPTIAGANGSASPAFAGSQDFRWGYAVTGSNPSECTMFAIARLAANGAERTVIGQCHTASSNPLFRLESASSVTNSGWRAQYRGDSGTALNLEWGVATNLDTSKYYAVVGVFRSGTGVKELWVDGVLYNSGTTNIGGITLDRTEIGVLSRNSPIQWWSGDIPVCGIYNYALSEGELLTLSENMYRPFHKRKVLYFLGGAGNQIDLVGAAVAASTATASLATSITVAGAGAGNATATGALTTGIPLAVSATVSATATGALTAEIRFNGAALAIATAVAALSTGIQLDGDAIGAAVASGALTTGSGGLEGAAMAQALATGDLTTAVLLASDALATALAQAGLTTGVPLAGAAQSAATATATLTTSINLAGQGAGVTTAAAELTGGSGSAQLEGAAQVVGSATGDLSTGIPLQGAAISATAADGTLNIQIALAGAALAQAIAQGGLTASINLSGTAAGAASAIAGLAGSVLVYNPRFEVADNRSDFEVVA